MAGIDSGTVAAAALLATGSITGASLAIGPSPVTLTQIAVFAPTLTPSSVPAASAPEQMFTVPGLTTADRVILNGPAPNGCPPVHARVSALNTLAVTFANPTAGALTPAAGTYTIIALRS